MNRNIEFVRKLILQLHVTNVTSHTKKKQCEMKLTCIVPFLDYAFATQYNVHTVLQQGPLQDVVALHASYCKFQMC